MARYSARSTVSHSKNCSDACGIDLSDRQHPSAGIVRSLATSPGGENVTDSLSGILPAGSVIDSFTAYGWSAEMQGNAPVFVPDGDFWMGDSGDVSWLSTMPFVTGTTS